MARYFRGVAAASDKVTVANYAAIDNLNTLTIAAWVYQISGGPGGFGIITDKTTGWGIGAPLNAPRFYANRWTGQGEWELNLTTPLNVWRHLVITYDYGSTANVPIFYIDGTARTLNIITTPTGTAATASNTHYLGNRAAGDLALDGYLAEFAVWNRVLSAGEVTTAYTSGANAVSSGLVEYFPLCGTASPEPNPASPANTGTLTGTVFVDHPSIAGTPCITATLSGTALAGINETDIRTGGKTIVITLAGDTWIP